MFPLPDMQVYARCVQADIHWLKTLWSRLRDNTSFKIEIQISGYSETIS